VDRCVVFFVVVFLEMMEVDISFLPSPDAAHCAARALYTVFSLQALGDVSFHEIEGSSKTIGLGMRDRAMLGNECPLLEVLHMTCISEIKPDTKPCLGEQSTFGLADYRRLQRRHWRAKGRNWQRKNTR
jgi:hypothetical protein